MDAQDYRGSRVDPRTSSDGQGLLHQPPRVAPGLSASAGDGLAQDRGDARALEVKRWEQGVRRDSISGTSSQAVQNKRQRAKDEVCREPTPTSDSDRNKTTSARDLDSERGQETQQGQMEDRTRYGATDIRFRSINDVLVRQPKRLKVAKKSTTDVDRTQGHLKERTAGPKVAREPTQRVDRTQGLPNGNSQGT